MGEALSILESPEGQCQDIGAAGTTQESVLLSQLIQLLQQRDPQSLLLSDLGALLPTVVRQQVKDQGGLRTWLNRYPTLFYVTGAPGKESVTLCIGGSPHAGPPETLTLSSMVPEPSEAMVVDPDAEAEEDINSQCAVQLRGLPYRATLEDVVAFLGPHSSDLAESNAVQLVQNRDGRPSGFARVQFSCPESAKRCVSALHLRSMEDRYVEVFLYSERPSKGRQRRGGHEEFVAAASDAARLAAAADASGVTREQVVRECRMQMSDTKNRRMLLSMLGVALSQGARSYLKQMDQGLKHFLTQFPTEFSVDGGKGCEYVTYSPTQLSLSQAIDGFEDVSTTRSFEELAAKTASPKPAARAALAGSPDQTATGGPASATRGIATPSDWGTPYPPGGQGAGQWSVPAWPQGAAGSDANPWASMPNWPMPGAGYGWPGWPGSFPYNMDAPPPNPADAAAAAAFGSASGGAAAGSAAPVHAAAGALPAAPSSGPTTAVRLRGLPFTSAEQDVLAFFAQHDIVDRIADGPKAVNILTRSNGRPSGQAIIQMRESQDAELAQSLLHGQWMGSRYIEVFLMSQEENEAAGAHPSTSPSKSGTYEPISLAAGVPAAGSSATAGATSSTVPDLSSQFPQYGGAGMGPPWQANMWSAAMASSLGSTPPPIQDFGTSEGASWEALFEFLGPEGQAAMAGQFPPPDPAAMAGFGMPPLGSSGTPPAGAAAASV